MILHVEFLQLFQILIFSNQVASFSEKGATYRFGEQAFAFNKSKANLLAITISFHGLNRMVFTAWFIEACYRSLKCLKCFHFLQLIHILIVIQQILLLHLSSSTNKVEILQQFG